MSMTNSVGVYSPGYWSSMAFTMMESLQEMLRLRRRVEIPETVHRDAVRFLQLGIDANSKPMPSNLSASINAYRIAADALRSAELDITNSSALKREDLAEMLSSYLGLLQRLPNLTELKEDDLQLIRKARLFFGEVAKEGENEAYESTISFEDEKIGIANLRVHHGY